MFIKSLVLKNFRNFQNLHVDLAPTLNMFVGENGQGKTSLIEALYILLRGYSFRPGDSLDWIHKEAGPQSYSFLNTQIIQDELDFKILAHFDSSQKKFFLNQKPIHQQRLLQLFPIVLFTPESLLLIKEGPEKRRDLLDEVVLSIFPQFSTQMSQYKKILKTRNLILRKLSREEGRTEENHRVLQSLNPLFLNLAVEYTEKRLLALKVFMPSYQKACKELFSNENVDISVDYVASGELLNQADREQIHNAIYKRAMELRNAEIATGKSLVGPHKHDIKLLYNGNDSRFFCSQGQQRSLVLGFKLALVETYYTTHLKQPVLFLDDVLSELDLERRWYLIRFLKQIKTQILMTTTDLNLLDQFSDSLGTVFTLKQGQITKSGQLNREGIRV